MLKKIFLPLASAILAWQSYKFLSIIQEFEINSWGLLFFLAWIINMIVTGVFAITGFAHPTQKLLPESYYHVHKPKRLKYIYKLLRVDLFRKFLLATVWREKKQRQKYFNGKRSGFSTLEEQSMKSEFGHLMPFIILNAIALYLIAIGMVTLGVFTIIWNLLGNFYPIILQRHHRMRLQFIKQRKQLSETISKSNE